MNDDADNDFLTPELLIKSSQRIRDLGEVFTPSLVVERILDMLPAEMWQIHPQITFLEPSAGNGNFVAAILKRKLEVLDEAWSNGLLPAGNTVQAAEFHALQALSSIYGVDISEENIIGGSPGHEIACRPRLLSILSEWQKKHKQEQDAVNPIFLENANWILEHNMVVGNMLDRDANGNPNNRGSILVVEYLWNPLNLGVQLKLTTMQDVIEAELDLATGEYGLFGPKSPINIWEGKFDDLSLAPNHAVVNLVGVQVSNNRVRD
jgi:hypothetical protein